MRNKLHWSLRKKITWSLAGLALVVFSIFGYYAYSLYSFADRINTDPEDSRFSGVRGTTVGTDLEPPKWEGKERVNIVLLGGDTRGMRPNDIPRSDSIMIVSLDPVTKKSYLFSIMRDTYVKIPGYGSDRINTAITYGGPELAMKTISDLMGMPIQYFVYTDFEGFIALVDAVGGIELDVEKDMKYSDSADDHQYDIDLKKGYQHLDGKTALQYVRFRHDAMSDFARTERQRKFMTALAQEMQSTMSIIKLPKILQSIDPYIETNLSVTQMLKLASLGFEIRTDGLVSQQIPPMELLEEKRVGGAAVLGVNTDKLHRFVQELFGSTTQPASTAAPNGKLSMGDSSGDGSAAGSSGGSSTSGSSSSWSGSTSTKAPAATVRPTARPAAKPAATAKPTAKPTEAPSVQPSEAAEPTTAPSPTPQAVEDEASRTAPPDFKWENIGQSPSPGDSSSGNGAGGQGGQGAGGDLLDLIPTPTAAPITSGAGNGAGGSTAGSGSGATPTTPPAAQ